jgi:hypothetical protein
VYFFSEMRGKKFSESGDARGFVLIWLYASQNHRLIHKNLDDGFIAHLTRRYLLTIALYFAAVLLSMLHALAGLALCVGLTLAYLLPSRKPLFHCDEEGEIATTRSGRVDSRTPSHASAVAAADSKV